MRLVLAMIALFGLCAGCTRTSTVPLAADTIQITVTAAPLCGAVGAQEVAIRYAAAETIKAGFDRFIVIGQKDEDNVGVIGYTPMTARTTSTGTASSIGNTVNVNTQSNTTFSGGQPIVGGHHDNTLVIKMFRDSDEAAASAISARHFLGPDWQTAVQAHRIGTCF